MRQALPGRVGQSIMVRRVRVVWGARCAVTLQVEARLAQPRPRRVHLLREPRNQLRKNKMRLRSHRADHAPLLAVPALDQAGSAGPRHGVIEAPPDDAD